MQKIAIYYKEEDNLISSTASQLIKELKQEYKIVKKDPDLVLTLGGDGTILRAARTASKIDCPILGVHLGGVGLLTEINLEEINTALKKIKEKKYIIDERAMIEADILKRGKAVKSFVALNDIVIGKNEIARTIRLEAVSGKMVLADYAADGLIISTPTGSTAYNYAVGGPILPPHCGQFIISPICPHRSADRSIVYDKPVTVEVTKGRNVMLTADGQRTFSLHQGDKILIKPSAKKTKFLRFKEYDLWGLMRQRLNWGYPDQSCQGPCCGQA
ncbi:MAG: NAD(+)/NADH kinase [Candidatus Margulisiibacteriota bacterium]|nr:NAD(+)/NADH kinase [Candidatus Margulisiibacteriota bacterium]